MARYSNYIYSTFALLSMFLVLIPLPWHLEAWNTGTCLYMIWTALGCLNHLVNSILWNKNAINWSPPWCDVSSRIVIALNVAIPSASLCINRRLYHIASVQSATVTRREKRRAIIVDLAIGLGIPFMQEIFYYIVEGHRFDIFEDYGCFPAIHNTPLAIAFVWTWPLIIGIVSAIYCSLTIRAFAKRRAQFKELLSSNNNLSSDRYFRLMALAGVDLLCTVPLASWSLYNNMSAANVHPYISWANTHSNFSRVVQYPRVLYGMDRLAVIGLEVTRWSVVGCAVIFFAFFGFADEARKHYKLAFNSVAKKMGYSTASVTATGGSTSNGPKPEITASFGGGIPSFINPLADKGSVGAYQSKMLKEKPSMDSMFDRYSARISIGSVYNDLQLKEKDKEGIDRPVSPSSSSMASSRRSSVEIEIDIKDLPPTPSSGSTTSPQLDPTSPPQHSADTPSAVRHSHTDDIV